MVDGENSGEIFKLKENGYLGSTFRTLDISKVVSEDFALKFIESKQDYLKLNKVGSAIPHLNKKIFSELEFPLVSKQYQEKVVIKLSQVNQEIERLR